MCDSNSNLLYKLQSIVQTPINPSTALVATWQPRAKKSDATRARLLAPGRALRDPPCAAALAQCMRQRAQAQLCRARAMLSSAMLATMRRFCYARATMCPSQRGEPSQALATTPHMLLTLPRTHPIHIQLHSCSADHCSTGDGLSFLMFDAHLWILVAW